MNANHGKGKKYSPGKPIDKGLTESMAIEGGTGAKLRGETNLQTQRPVEKTESVKSDRGSFPSKC